MFGHIRSQAVMDQICAMETEMLNSYRRKSQMKRTVPLCGIIVLCWSLPAQAQVNFTWQGDNNDNWQNSANWSQTPGSGDIPDSQDHFVFFDDSADRFQVDLNSGDRVVGGITIDTTNPAHDYRFYHGTLRNRGDLSASTSGLDVVFSLDLTYFQQSAGTWTKDSGVLIFNSPLAGNGNISLNSGIARFNTVCTYSGQITTSATGKIRLGVGNALQDARVAINSTNGLDLNFTDATVGALSGTGSIDLVLSELAFGGTNLNRTFQGAITGSAGLGGATLVKDGSGTQTFTGSITNVNTLTVNAGEVIVDGGTALLTESSISGAVVLTGGDMTIENGATVELNAAFNTGGTARLNSRTLTIDGGQLICSRIISNSEGVIALSDGVEPALVIGEVDGFGVTQATNGTFVDAAGGPGSIRKVGTGTLYLNGANTNTGGVTVEEGSIGGTGSVVGLTQVASGAQIRPGQPVGVFAAEDVVFDSGSTLAIDIGGTTLGTDYDNLLASGAVALAGTLDLSYINSFTAAAGDGFVVLKADSISGQFDAVNFPDGQAWSIVYEPQAGIVSVILCSDPQSGDCAECDAGAPFVVNVTQNAVHGTIQSAIDAATSGDTLELSACVFHERGINIANKSLTLRGRGSDKTFIDGDNINGAILTVTNSNPITIENLTIRNGAAGQNPLAAGLNIEGSNVVAVVRDVVFEGNHGVKGGGLGISAATVKVERCRFLNNSSSSLLGGSSVWSAVGAHSIIVNCLFSGDQGPNAPVFVLGAGPTETELVNCTFVDCLSPRFALANLTPGSSLTIRNSAFDASALPYESEANDPVLVSRCLFPGASFEPGDNIDGVPTFEDAANGDYRLATGSLGIEAADYGAYTAANGGATDLGGEQRLVDDPCVADSGLGSETYLDIGAYEWQVHQADIDADGIPDACDNCPDVPNVWNITQDTFYPTIKAAISAANSGDILELGPCVFNERRIDFGGKNLTLRGQGPNETIVDGDHAGGVIFEIKNAVTVTIENLAIRNGSSGYRSAGILVEHNFASLTLTDVALEGNNGDNCGAIFVDAGTATLKRCLFRGNSCDSASGTASFVAREGAEVSIVDCAFVGESGGLRLGYAVAGTDEAHVELTNCTFADYDGLHFLQAHNVAATIDAVNCAFGVSNAPDITSGGGLLIHSRCLFAGATGDNIDGLPTFVDAGNGDYRLAAGSLGIDAGDYDAYVAAGCDATDLGDESRLVDDLCLADTGVGGATYLDVGAYEFQADNTDSDGDGVPDACDPCPNRKLGDVNGDGNVDTVDVAMFVQLLTNPGNGTADELCAADVNEDTLVDGEDIQPFVALILAP